MAGRKPLPTAAKQLRGNPGKRPINKAEPKPQVGAPEMPAGLCAVAQVEWARIIPELEAMKVLTRVDGSALAAYCQAFARWLQAEAEIDRNGITFISMFLNKDGEAVAGDIKKNPAVTVSSDCVKIMGKFLAEFGMTPSSRSRLQVAAQGDEVDPMEEFLSAGEPAVN